MIPKIIHYTWFSGDEMPQTVKECIASWRQYLPDYEFRRWDMKAIEIIDSTFLQEAVSVKKWAYAADYVRLYALYHDGGIYLDTDVMVYKPFDDLLSNHVFIGKENTIHELPLDGKWIHYLTSHCMGADPGSEYIKDCLNYFDGRHFILSHNEQFPHSLRYNYVLLPYIQAEIARGYGYDGTPKQQKIQYCKDGLVIYPSDYFNGFSFIAKSYCEHFGLGSWRGNYDALTKTRSFAFRLSMRIKRFIRNTILNYAVVIKKV